MATPVTTEPSEQEEEEQRRKRALALIADIRRRLDMVCPQIQQVDRGADLISEIIDKTRELASLTGAKGLLPAGVRKDLADAADRFERWRTRVGDVAGLCDRLYGALDEAERILAARAPASQPPGRRSIARVVAAGLAVVAAVVAAVVLSILLFDDDDDTVPTNPGGGGQGGAVVSPSAEQPDLTISMTAVADTTRRSEDGQLATMTVEVVVRNIGKADSGPFTVTALQLFAQGRPKPVEAFRVGGNANLQTPIVPSLRAGAAVRLRGDISVPISGREFPGAKVIAVADWCDPGTPPCNVVEANERNNESNVVEMLPIAR